MELKFKQKVIERASKKAVLAKVPFGYCFVWRHTGQCSRITPGSVQGSMSGARNQSPVGNVKASTLPAVLLGELNSPYFDG